MTGKMLTRIDYSRISVRVSESRDNALYACPNTKEDAFESIRMGSVVKKINRFFLLNGFIVTEELQGKQGNRTHSM